MVAIKNGCVKCNHTHWSISKCVRKIQSKLRRSKKWNQISCFFHDILAVREMATERKVKKRWRRRFEKNGTKEEMAQTKFLIDLDVFVLFFAFSLSFISIFFALAFSTAELFKKSYRCKEICVCVYDWTLYSLLQNTLFLKHEESTGMDGRRWYERSFSVFLAKSCCSLESRRANERTWIWWKIVFISLTWKVLTCKKQKKKNKRKLVLMLNISFAHFLVLENVRMKFYNYHY